ncbi:MAG: DNA-processing protein DprA [Tannerellaceae bacterium]|nr:DNA-processing protein DprA [Tannerellaceae bacterium]
MKYSDNSVNILTARTYKRIGKAWIIKNLKGNDSIETIVELLNRDSKENHEITIEEFEKNKQKIEYGILKLEDSIDGVISMGDKDFPPCRGEVKPSERPIVLFYRGDLNLLKPSNKNIAVIGLLNPDPETEHAEQEVVSELVKKEATIVSGLALGCDSIAHKQALASQGKTVAILPGPLNSILPATNKDLADEIVTKKGLLITEYYEDFKSKMELSSRYQERDRLQALFSDCIILSASYAKNDQGNDSGSRLAMEYALKYAIPRAVIYDTEKDINNPKYDLNRQLMKEDKRITIINSKNLSEVVNKILSNKNSQPNLFDMF